MLVHDFVDVALPVEDVTSQVADPARWARALGGRVAEGDRTLLARFGLDGVFPFLGKMVEIRVGTPRHQDRGTVIDVEWQPAYAEGTAPVRPWYPVMHADLVLSSLGSATTHVEFNGSYLPPGGLPGRVADRVVMHHVAERAVRMLLDRLVQDLKGVDG